jgi:hypothetical protein
LNLSYPEAERSNRAEHLISQGERFASRERDRYAE